MTENLFGGDRFPVAGGNPVPRLLPGYALPSSHPLAGREAYQCDVCEGICYPPAPPSECPYCNDEDAE